MRYTLGNMSLSSHRFFAATHVGEVVTVEELPPPPWQSSIKAELRYIYDVLEHALPIVKAEGLHFYFTNEAYMLPEYGSHVVSVLYHEERCKVPVYSRHVRATIRYNQSKPFLGFRLHRRMGRLEAVLFLEYIRDWYLHIRSRIALDRPHPEWPKPVRKEPVVIMLPFGYHSQDELPIRPMAERTVDTFFAGEVKHAVSKTSYRYWLSTSKFLARAQVYKELRKLVETKKWKIELSTIGSTERKQLTSLYDSYSEKMMNSRICTAARGSVAETFRAFEGIRAGCLVVLQCGAEGEFFARCSRYLCEPLGRA